jgi:hypothetical protein
MFILDKIYCTIFTESTCSESWNSSSTGAHQRSFLTHIVRPDEGDTCVQKVCLTRYRSDKVCLTRDKVQTMSRYRSDKVCLTRVKVQKMSRYRSDKVCLTRVKVQKMSRYRSDICMHRDRKNSALTHVLNVSWAVLYSHAEQLQKLCYSEQCTAISIMPLQGKRKRKLAHYSETISLHCIVMYAHTDCMELSTTREATRC